MNTEIIVSILSGLFSLTGIVATVLAEHKKTQKQIEAGSKLTLYRIEQLEIKQDKHNTLIERMYKAEDDIHVLDERLKVANHRLDDLEHQTN